jgi:ankyrin repeat protein
MEKIKKLYTGRFWADEMIASVGKLESESSKANWFEFFETLKPGSRHGTGGRLKRNEPPWARNTNVIDELKSIQYGKKTGFDETTAQKLRSIIAGCGDESLSRLSSDVFCCRKVPFAVLENSPVAKIMCDFIHRDTAWYLICPENQTLNGIDDLLKQKDNVVLVANSISVDLNALSSVLPYVHGLALSANNLSQVGFKLLFSELEDNGSVRTLSITENSLLNIGCSCIQSCLIANERIQSLILSSNEIGDDGAKSISAVLMPCKCFSLMEAYVAEDRVCEFVILLRHGYPANGLGDDLLQKAVEFGSVRIAEYLIDQNADPCSGDDSKSCLSRACALGHLPVVELLISRKADISHRNSEGRSALSEAACNGHDAIVKMLIRQSRCRRTELVFSIKTLELIPKEVNIKKPAAAKRNSLISWFSFESSSSHPSQEKEILKSGLLNSGERAPKVESCEQDGQNSFEDRSSSVLFFKLELNSHVQKYCVQCSPRAVQFEINQTASFIITNECFISSNTELDIVFGISNTLLEETGEPDEEIIGRGKFRLTTVGFSIKHCENRFIRLYDSSGGVAATIKLSAIAKIPFLNETSKIGDTALQEACRKGYVDVVKVLAENGADVDCKDRDENNPLITSSRLGFEDLVRTLLSFRANFQSTNRAGVSALIAAQRHNFTNIVQMLQCHDMAAHRVPLAIKRLHLDSRQVKISEYEGIYKPFTFQLTIAEGRNLPVADVTGMSDPFCRVTFNHQERKTRVIHRNLNPKWNQTFVFDNQLLSVWENSSLLFEVFDSNIVTDSTLLGRRKFDFAQFMSACSDRCTEWVPNTFFLEGEDGSRVQNANQIDSELQIKFQVSKGLGQYLRIGVIGATNLPLTKTRNSEAFCSLQYGDEAVDTPSVSRSTSVSWNFFVNFKAKRVDETLRIELRDLYARKKSIQETESLAILEISPNILFYLISSNLNEMDFEIYDRDGSPLKGPGGHISSIRLEFALSVQDADGCAVSEDFTPSLQDSAPQRPGTEPSSSRCSCVLGRGQCIFCEKTWLSREVGPRSISISYEFCPEIQPDAITKINEKSLVKKNIDFLPYHDALHLSPKHTNNFLVNLNLDQNKVSDLGITYLAHSLKSNHVLKSLSLNENKFGPNGATALSTCLALNSCLSQLRISKNRIRDEGLREVCKALTSNVDTKIQLLNVGENGIGAIGMRFLGRLFACNRTLQALSVNNNCVGGDGSFLLAQGLRKNSSIQELDLSFSVLGDLGVCHLAQSLRRNSKILGKAMAANRSLKIVNLSGNSLTEKSVNALIDCVQHNRVLHTIIMDDYLPSESLSVLRDCIRQNLEQAQLELAVVKIQRAFRFSQFSRLRKANVVNLRAALIHQVYGSPTVPGCDQKDSFDQSKENDKSGDDEILPVVRRTHSPNNAADSEGFISGECQDLQGMLIAATSVTMFNLGDAVILEHEAAYALAQEAATKLSAAAQNYSRLEDFFYQLMLDESSDQAEIVLAVDQLVLARDAILNAIEESRVAEEAGMKCLQGADTFAICETEEAHMFGAWHEGMNLNSGSTVSVKEDDGIIEYQDDNPYTFASEFQGQISKQTQNGIIDSNSNQFSTMEVLESQESDEDLISSAFKEFFGKSDDQDSAGRQDPARGLEQLEIQLSVLRNEEIAACSSAALEELGHCMKEISVLKQLIGGYAKTGEASGMLSIAVERCMHLKDSFNESMGCAKGHEFRFCESLLERLQVDANELRTMDGDLGVSNPGWEGSRVNDSDENLISDALNEFL